MSETLLAGNLSGFFDPGMIYRGAPFWSWNGNLEPEELRKQIRLMKDAGMGGFFMHARTGLETPYLSRRWFECVKASVDEAAKHGMKAYIYDEDRWPSGSGGGTVTFENKYRQRVIVMERFSDTALMAPRNDQMAGFVVKVTPEQQLKEYRRCDEAPEALAEGEEYLRFASAVMSDHSWYNGSAYINPFDPAAVRSFIDTVYERYYQEIPEAFGTVAPGIFTDEPSFGNLMREAAPMLGCRRNHWSDTLLERIQQENNYDLRDYLPELFFPWHDERKSQVAFDYTRILAEEFCQNYSRQLGQWCADHNIAFTGHLMCEESLSLQTLWLGDAMRNYEYMQLPGMDLLCECNQHFETAKQVSSVAHQFNYQWRLSETYGCTGWQFPFAGHKALGDWQAALGINLRCQHLAWYTMQGEAKRDFPAAISWQSPWFGYYRCVEDYFARVNWLLSEGEEVREVLVLHPIESMWFYSGGLDLPVMKELSLKANRRFEAIRNKLLCRNIDYDYGNEDILSRHGSVAHDATGRVVLKINQALYRAVVVPQAMETMRSGTLELLIEFARQGGVLLAEDGSLVNLQYIDGRKNLQGAKELTELLQNGDWLEILSEKFAPIRITTPENKAAEMVLYQLRKRANGGAGLFICNTGFETAYDNPVSDWTRSVDRTKKYPELTVKIQLEEACGVWLELDCEQGKVYRAQVTELAPGVWSWSTSLEALQSRSLLLVSEAEGVTFDYRPEYRELNVEQLSADAVAYTMDEPNVAVLDIPEFRVGRDGVWQPADFILKIDKLIRARRSLEPRGGGMVQPWRRPKFNFPKEYLELKYTFEVAELPSGTVFLALEQPELYHCYINNVEVKLESAGEYWTDESNHKIALPEGILQNGINTVLLTTEYDYDLTGLEAIFLLGDFGVESVGNMMRLTAKAERLKIGDWCQQGLACYGGNVTYQYSYLKKQNFREHLCVRFPKFQGTAVRVLVNGQEAGIAAWPPYEVDMTAKLQDGENTLSFEVLGSRRNSHGPFFSEEAYPIWTGPMEMAQFEHPEERCLWPSGLLSEPLLIYKVSTL